MYSNAFLDDMWVLSGDIDQTQEVSCNNRWFSYAHFHGLLMYLAFGLLFPVGIIVASSCKHSKGGFIAHVTIQVSFSLIIEHIKLTNKFSPLCVYLVCMYKLVRSKPRHATFLLSIMRLDFLSNRSQQLFLQ